MKISLNIFFLFDWCQENLIIVTVFFQANQTKKMEYKRDFSSFKRKALKTGGGRNPPLPPELGGSDLDTESDGEQNFKGE